MMRIEEGIGCLVGGLGSVDAVGVMLGFFGGLEAEKRGVCGLVRGRGLFILALCLNVYYVWVGPKTSL